MFLSRTVRGTISLAVLLAPLVLTAALAADLKVVIDGVRGDKGTVMVALFNDAPAFKADARFAGAFMTAKPGRVVVGFPELAPGTYAVSAFHDENGSGVLETNFLGIPNEGYGFSNNAKGFAGPPSFGAASVALEDKHLTVTLKLAY